MMWGNYNGTPNQTVTILEGIQQQVGKGNVKYLRGCDLTNDQTLESWFDLCSFNGKKGMKATFWNNRTREGQPVSTIQVQHPVNVTTYGQHNFGPNVNIENFSAKYETVLKAKETCDILLAMTGCSDFELLVDGKSVYKDHTWRTTETRTIIPVEKGREYRIEILYADVQTWAANLKFDLGKESPIDYQAAIDQLKGIDKVVFVGGISPALEGEEMPVEIKGFKGGDRTDIELPAVQRNFIKALRDAGKKIVYINCSGSAIALQPEADRCDAIVQAWYAGEQGGTAIAEILYGKVNPSAKLPVTFYKNSSQLPDFEDYSMKGRTYRYFNDALYPFGYGLSYTTFAVGTPSYSGGKVTVEVKNTGSCEGTEVVQLYLKNLADKEGPSKSLRGFQRVPLKAGESSVVTFSLGDEDFEWFDEQSNTVRPMNGDWQLFVGTSSADKDLKSIKINR
jgi:beta-glucosidase